MLDIDIIKIHKDSKKIYITEHCDQRMRLRGITNHDIYCAIDNGVIIKQYEDDKHFKVA